MLPKSERLKERHLFNIVFKKKQKINSDILSLYYLLQKKDINRFVKNIFLPKTSFITGLRVDKRATKRNLVKRRMKAAYKLIMKKAIKQNVNKVSVLIWIANPSIKNVTFEQIKSSMEKLLVRLDKSERINFFESPVKD